MTALVIGAVLAVAALAYVLLPLFDAVVTVMPRRSGTPAAPSESAIDALREIEFDRATGKLSDDDYAALKAEYTRSALVELRARGDTAPVAPAVTSVAETGPEIALGAPGSNGTPNGSHAPGTSSATDVAEAAVLRLRSMRRSCDTCGPRPEPDPAFCSSCGRYLRGACVHCGATIDKPASRFCAHCGGSLAA